MLVLELLKATVIKLIEAPVVVVVFVAAVVVVSVLQPPLLREPLRRSFQRVIHLAPDRLVFVE